VATFSLTINGVERPVRVETFDIAATLNGPDTLAGEFISDDGLWAPAKRDEIVFTLDSVRKFAGFITSVRLRGVDGPGGDGGDGTIAAIVAEDYSGQTRRRFITVTIAAGQTIKQAVQAILGATTLTGVTLAVGQANGPTLTEDFNFVNTRVSDALDAVVSVANDLDAVGWYWRINYDGDLQAFEPGVVAAPWNLTEGDGSECGDVETQDDESEDYANKVIVDGGRINATGHTESFVADGVTTVFHLEYTPVSWWVVTVDTIYYETIGTSPAIWALDPIAKTIERVTSTGYLANPLPNGTPFFITFDGFLDVVGTAVTGTAAASPPTDVIEARVSVDGLTTLAQADARAAAILAVKSASTKTATYPTDRGGLSPGQTQTLTVPKRSLTGDWLITSVRTIYHGAAGTDGLRYMVGLSEGGVLKGDFRTTYRQWIEAGNGASAGSAVTVVSGVSTAPAPAAGSLIGVQKITATGAYTYTPSPGTGSVIVEIIGGGGGGAGVASAGVNQVNLGGGGGSGAYGLLRLTSGFTGATGSVGAKGTGGAAGNNDGTNGGNTTFITTGSVTYMAGGGAKGVCRTSFAPPITAGGGAGGTTTGSFDVSVNGSGGFYGVAPNQFVGFGGGGAGSRFGPYSDGAPVGNATSTAGPAASGHGSGGSGATSSNAGGAKAGGDGSDGLVIIWEYR